MSSSRLNVVHRHGQCSSRARQDKPSHVELLRQDQARVDYIHFQAANATTRLNPFGGSLFAGVPVSLGKALRTSNYIIIIGFGTPTKSFSVAFDTGTDITWTQCVPCSNCYTQKDPFYDPTQSSTFTDISCNSEYCIDLKKFGCSSTSTCLYHQEYDDNSYSNGSFIQDTLTFSSDTIHNFRFGCGHNNSGLFGQTDGLLGLGRGDVSIISQTSQLYGKIFSYCLPSETNTIGYLELGSSVPDVKYTPMLTNPSLPTFYFLKLIAISVAGARLALSPTIFSGPGTMLDSGTVISRLPPTAYSALRDAFKQYMTKYPMAPPLSILDTCYNITNYETVYVPSIALIFDDEVTATLDFSGIVYTSRKSRMCLAFAKNDDDSEVVIIGNVQQRRFNIVYDVGNLRIGFGANGCS
ncbi:aspartyl protease family protein At5g10770-like [Dendrobium catenatum]|nr:aspartyl protease family protein At5g10770-like [Dendrobium catenatum]